MKIISHRGFSSKAPENTFSSFDMAISSGFNIIEFDVQLTKDLVPVIMHDEEIDRTTNSNGILSEIEYKDLLKFDAGIWFDKKYKNERVPTLIDLLRKYEGKAHLQIELKSVEPELPLLTIDLIKKTKWRNVSNEYPYMIPGFSITSFNLDHILKTIEIEKHFPVGWLLEKEKISKNKILNVISDYQVKMIIPNVNDSLWNDQDFIELLKARNIKLCAWGAQVFSDVKKMLKAGAAAMTVDWPDEAIKFI